MHGLDYEVMMKSAKVEFLVCASCALYVFYFVFVVERKLRLVCRMGRMRRFLTANMGGFVKSFYRTPIWCIGANLQSVVSMFIQSRLPPVHYRRQYLDLSDGGRLALDWLNEDLSGPVLLVAPGLTGDSQSYYLRSLIPLVRAMYCPCVVMNGRGRGGVPLSTHRITHMASVADLREVVEAIGRRFPGECLLAVGYSLGGLLISLYLAEYGADARIDAALAISTPFHLPTTKYNLLRWNTNYAAHVYMAHNLVEHLKDNESVLRESDEVNADAVLSCWTLVQFDEIYTAPVFGFSSTDELYETCSLRGKLSRIRRPMVFVSAADDVFNSPSTFPEEEIFNSPWLAAVITPRGGHLGFVDGWFLPSPPFYSERFAATFVHELLRIARSRGPEVFRELGDD